MFGAILGAGASLLGGLFGGGSKKQETTTTNHVDYRRMVREAEAAGFNPLTALRNGGAAGFSVSTGTTPATPLSERLVNGITGATQSFLTNFDPFADQQRDLGFRVAEAQLANLQADTSLKRIQLGAVPSYTAGTQKRTMGAGVKQGQTFKSAADVLPASAGKSQTPTVEAPTVTNPFPTSWGVEINPNLPDASAYEERYGDSEIFQLIYGMGNVFGDVNHNLNRLDRHISNKYEKPVKKYFTDSYNKSTTKSVFSELWEGGISFRKHPPLSSPRKY